jgi:XTP/dITP diphosphohydrolase
MEIILASGNLHKIREFKEILKSFPHIELISLHQFPHYAAPEETGLTFKENAILKAEHAAKTLNRWVIADDSGLVVSSLKGQPGVYSRRYAGPDATDAENRKKLLSALKEHNSPDRRTAYYECALAIASPEGLKKCVTGTCEGYISTEEKGRNGFGYDSLFIKHDYEKTFSELEESIKNRISHRRKAFERLAIFLEMLKST